MSRLLAAVFVFALVLTARAAPVPKHLMPKDEPYWPTAVGTKWVYEQEGKDMTEEITKAEAIKGGTRLTVRRVGGGVDQDIVDVAPDGVTRRSTGQFTLDKQIVRFPLQEGDSWKFAIPIQPGLVCHGGTITVGKAEDIKVPAGTFRATKVVSVATEIDGKPIEKACVYTFWYAKGVGLVRLEWEGGGRALKSFAPGKP